MWARHARASQLLLAGLLGACWLLPMTAHGDNRWKGEAERRNRTAKKLYNQGHYQSAMTMWQSAYDLHPDPRYLFNVALSKEKVSDHEGCALRFRDFLLETEANQDLASVREAAQSRMKACLAKTMLPVRFTSVPTNAAILIGVGAKQESRGRTPRELRLAPGKHQVTVTLPGYVAQEQVIEVVLGERTQPDFVLEKLSSLHIEVDPTGARVRIGEDSWESAPLTRRVQAGTYEVQVEKAGHEPEQRQVQVSAGQEKSILLSLRPLPKIRKISVTSASHREPRARVEVDGRRAGILPVETTLSPGKHEIRVRAPGHVPFASSIIVPEDRDLRLEVSLEPKRSRRNRATLWGLLAATGTATIVGSTYGILALSDKSKFDDDRNNVDLYNSGRRRTERADLWLGTGLLFGAGTIAYYYFTRPGRSTGKLE